jgi:hypothetical protein
MFFLYKSDVLKNNSHMFNHELHMTKNELDIKSTCQFFIEC